MDKKLAKMEALLEGRTSADDAQLRREAKLEKAAKKKEQKVIREAARKSLDVKNWTQAVLNGEQKFSGTVEESLEDKLSKETVGLVTFEELRAKKEELATQTEQAKRKAEEEAERDADKKKKAKEKKDKQSKSMLSFDDNAEDGEDVDGA